MRAVLAALLIVTPACVQSAPAVSVAEAYRAAHVACESYRLAPSDVRTPEADAACADILAVCVDARR